MFHGNFIFNPGLLLKLNEIITFLKIMDEEAIKSRENFKDTLKVDLKKQQQQMPMHRNLRKSREN